MRPTGSEPRTGVITWCSFKTKSNHFLESTAEGETGRTQSSEMKETWSPTAESAITLQATVSSPLLQTQTQTAWEDKTWRSWAHTPRITTSHLHLWTNSLTYILTFSHTFSQCQSWSIQNLSLHKRRNACVKVWTDPRHLLGLISMGRMDTLLGWNNHLSFQGHSNNLYTEAWSPGMKLPSLVHTLLNHSIHVGVSKEDTQ